VDFDYYKKAEGDVWINPFWAAEGPFVKLFQQLNTDSVLEIACGNGRHAAKIITNVRHLWLQDTSEGALDLARERFKDFRNMSYILSKDGLGIKKRDARWKCYGRFFVRCDGAF
jgi:SAM-dependent methyltransferase